MFQDRCYERDIDINNNFFADNMTNNMDTDFNMNNQMQQNMGMPFKQNQFSAGPIPNRMPPNMGMPQMMPNQMSAGMNMQGMRFPQ